MNSVPLATNLVADVTRGAGFIPQERGKSGRVGNGPALRMIAAPCGPRFALRSIAPMHEWLRSSGRSMRLVSLAFLLLAAAGVRAHDPGLSSAQFQVGRSEIRATLTLARADVETLGGVKRLGEVLPESLIIAFGTNRVGAVVGSVALGENDAVCQLSFPVLPGSVFTVESGLLVLLPRGHRQFVSVRDAAGRVVGEQLFEARQHALVVALSDVAAGSKSAGSFWQFLLLGIEHIATGFDHLAFLLGLLLVSGSFRDVLKVITAFTLAHSITLALAALEVIRVPPRVIEPLIAVSIVYVGVENLLQRGFERRWMLAFGFGLVHGCGFASALRDSGLGAGGVGIGLPLFSFNLGVELGQVALAVLVLPVLWRLKQRETVAPRLVAVCSALIALAGAWWLAARTVFA